MRMIYLNEPDKSDPDNKIRILFIRGKRLFIRFGWYYPISLPWIGIGDAWSQRTFGSVWPGQTVGQWLND
jgi:hypothetical protein